MQPQWTKIGDPAGGVLLTGGVTGASHRERAMPCQDASLAGVHFYKGHSYVLLAVADGHGAARYTRSELGAHFAVQAAAEAAARWMLSAVDHYEQQPDDWFANARNDFGLRFARMLRQAWERRVEEHLSAHPPDPTGNPPGLSAYGTTIALALVFRDQVFVGAVGDSTVLAVRAAEGGAVAADALAGAAADTLGLATHSLASADAPSRWQHRALPLGGLRLLCAVTDGFTDSLADAQSTLVGLCRDAQAKGLDWLLEKWPGFLQRLTERGVGDDIATALYFPPPCGSGLQPATGSPEALLYGQEPQPPADPPETPSSGQEPELPASVDGTGGASVAG
jgi:hypothetical protein